MSPLNSSTSDLDGWQHGPISFFKIGILPRSAFPPPQFLPCVGHVIVFKSICGITLNTTAVQSEHKVRRS